MVSKGLKNGSKIAVKATDVGEPTVVGLGVVLRAVRLSTVVGVPPLTMTVLLLPFASATLLSSGIVMSSVWKMPAVTVPLIVTVELVGVLVELLPFVTGIKNSS